jgi:23S rRNA pseudouridine2605 synthase
MPNQRLQKILAQAGIASRRRSEELLRAGRVSVNGQVVSAMGTQADPERDHIEVDGQRIVLEVEPVYFLLRKPRGYLSTCYDPQGRKTVLELVPYIPGLHPVGRLDRDTTGLLILSNDGSFTQALTHPRHGISKTYVAQVRGRPTPTALQTLRSGVRLEGGLTLPAQVELLEKRADASVLALTIREGRNRQVRRMLEAVGHPVIRLERVSIGNLGAGDLAEGQYRSLTSDEVRNLLQGAGQVKGRGGTRG